MKTGKKKWRCGNCGSAGPTEETLHEKYGCFKETSETGSKGSSGTVGAPGRLTHVSETLAPLPIGAFFTRGDGSNTYQGRVQGISSRLNEGSEEGYILTVFFDSRTSRRLRENLSGSLGENGTVAAGSSLTMVIGEPPTT